MRRLEFRRFRPRGGPGLLTRVRLRYGLLFLFCVLFAGCGPVPRDSAPHKTEVMVVVRTDQGEPLEGVMVRVGQERSVSDDEGVASFSLPVNATATLAAECPPRTQGEPLLRELRPAVLSAAPEWRTTLTCRPTLVEQSIAVWAEGCEKSEVWLDGALLGSTTEGLFHALRAIDEDGVARLEVRATQGLCEWEATGLDVSFSRDRPGIWAHFRGKRPAQRRAARKVRKEPMPHRPYRL